MAVSSPSHTSSEKRDGEASFNQREKRVKPEGLLMKRESSENTNETRGNRGKIKAFQVGGDEYLAGGVKSRSVNLTRDAAVAFYAGDVNGDAVLDFEEFCSIAPKSMRAKATELEMRTLFDSVDLDGNGSITLDE